MTVGGSLRAALADGYRQSWRLALVNAALGAGLVGAVYATLALPAAGAAVLVLLGPVAAALAHCAVVLAREEDLRLRDAVAGVRLHWRRGLALAAAAVAIVWLAVVAVRFYAGTPLWPLAFLAGYLAGAALTVQLLVWPLAVAHPEQPLSRHVREALDLVRRRPLAALGLAAALLLVNAAGVAAAVLPFLTLTVAYTFLAAAHFALAPENSFRNDHALTGCDGRVRDKDAGSVHSGAMGATFPGPPRSATALRGEGLRDAGSRRPSAAGRPVLHSERSSKEVSFG